MATENVKPVAVKLSSDIRARINRLAETRKRTAHWLMREAIQEYIEREEKRDLFRQTCFQAWNHYKATGKHLSFEEADAWLAKLEAGQDLEPPECHG